jgi:hypothetical protein
MTDPGAIGIGDRQFAGRVVGGIAEVSAISMSPCRCTSTGQKLFMRVRVDPQTHDPEGTPELVDHGTMADDFCIDEDVGVAYVTTHRENTIDRVPLKPKTGQRRSVAGQPFNELLLGPSSAAWSRVPGEYSRVAYFTTDGGQTAPPPDNIVRSAKVLRVEF